MSAGWMPVILMYLDVLLWCSSRLENVGTKSTSCWI